MSGLVPAWSLRATAVDEIALAPPWPERPTREWVFGGSTGEGARVCILDSGVDGSHPLVAPLDSAVAVHQGDDGEITVVPDEIGRASCRERVSSVV